MSRIKAISYAPEAWAHLKGIFCVYKPSSLSVRAVRNTLCHNLCRDLRELEPRGTASLVSLTGSVCSNKPFEVRVIPNYADHELVSGLRYQEQDVRMVHICGLGWNTSGVLLMAINDACYQAKNPNYRNFIRKYEIKAKFGFATRTFMSDGIVIERSTYHHIKQSALDRLLSSIQACHQSLTFKYSGIDVQSQEAYELASKGPVKPCTKSDSLIYSIKCTEFDLPHFTLEIHCINETEYFLMELIHDIGIDLRSTAVCTQLRQVQFGPFTLPHALLRKHWTLENILNNTTLCQTILDQKSIAEDSKSIKTLKQNLHLENMQNMAREECL